MPDRETVKARIDEVEAEMKRAGKWREEPLPPDAYDFHKAFAMDTMTFSSWLQFIFVPKVNQIIDCGGRFPTQSAVGAQAAREFDGEKAAGRLCSLLSEFDDLVESG